MTPVLTFFNNKGGVRKTSLVYRAAWMLSELDHTVLVVDPARRVRLGRRRIAEQAAQVDELLLGGGALLEFGGPPLRDELVRRHVLAHAVIGIQTSIATSRETP